MGGGTIVEIERPRSAFGLIGATFALYRRYPWLFLVLAAVVVVPYQALLAIPTLGVVRGAAKAWIDVALSIGDIALVLPLISALHVFAVDDVRQGRSPAISSVTRRGIAKLSIVSPAVFLTYLGITLGFIALIVPGVILLLRWAVVAQTGSLEASGWENAVHRSKLLTDNSYWHVFALLLLVAVITAIPSGILVPVYGLRSTSLAPFLIRSALAVATSSFTALATAFLYFDLTARAKAAQVGPEPVIVTVSGREVPPTGHPLDPASWSDEDRPRGWYVDPESPWRMRHWAADGQMSWSRRTAKTPKATLADWRDLRWVREKEERPEEPV